MSKRQDEPLQPKVRYFVIRPLKLERVVFAGFTENITKQETLIDKFLLSMQSSNRKAVKITLWKTYRLNTAIAVFSLVRQRYHDSHTLLPSLTEGVNERLMKLSLGVGLAWSEHESIHNQRSYKHG